MSVTPFRQALQAQLAADLGIAFVPGRIEGPVENRELGCVYPVRTEPWDVDILVERVILAVRVFCRYETPRSVEDPWDPVRLEALAESVKASVSAHQTGQGPWYQQLQAVEYDMVTQGFELTVLGWQANPAL